MTGKRATLALLVALGCTAASSPATAPAAPGQPHLNNLVQRAESTGSFTTFASLVRRAGLADTLSGRGPYTVFAPTNAAFARLPKATLTALTGNKARLRAVLLYHVIKGNVPASELATHSGQTTLDDGKTIRIVVSGKTVKVGDGTVIAPDRQTSNGTFYAVDRVLLPPS